MSLDVYLEGETTTEPCTCPHCSNEHERQVTQTLFESNITHNLGAMAEAAGIYLHCWWPEKLGITKARELIEPLRAGLARLKAKPQDFERYNASNGWGLYKNFVPWVEEYLAACETYPEATVRVSR